MTTHGQFVSYIQIELNAVSMVHVCAPAAFQTSNTLLLVLALACAGRVPAKSAPPLVLESYSKQHPA
jgi:hypothetical protein